VDEPIVREVRGEQNDFNVIKIADDRVCVRPLKLKRINGCLKDRKPDIQPGF